MHAGAFFGGLSSSYLANRFGRLKSIIFADLQGIVAAGVTIIPHTAPFALGRFLFGYMIGLSSSAASTYISEISSKEIRGRTGGFFQLLRMAGLTCSYALGLALPVDDLDNSMNNWWMVMFVFPSVFNLLQASIFLTVFKLESPYWLVSHGKEKETHAVLSSIYTDEETEHAVYDQISNFQEDPLV
jgi:MFS family permease